ncbi:MAG: hypothetical protein LN568_03350 [Rickettsia endosymbiont of Pseudomimeciton antennatum]|nr:hypothetical protein [Rickettsia endosymbiont of Pseudomimeciton antennatum]
MCNIITKSKFNIHLLITILLILPNLWTEHVYAIGYLLHNDNILELQIAKDAPTRINIEGEKINDIFIHPKEAAEIVIHNSGCLFILPQVGNNKVYLTLIGENGTVQDVILRFVGKSPSPVKLIKYDLNQDLTNIKEEKDVHKQASKTK